MKKRLSILFAIIFISFAVQAQSVGIGTIAPDASAMLDINSSSKGLLIPQLTVAQKNDMVAPANGLIIFLTDGESGIYYNSGISTAPVWERVTSKPGWQLGGNSGTTTANNFIGTLDDKNVVFKRNNIRAGLLSSSNTSWGESALNPNSTGIFNTAIGKLALASNTTGGYNAANGREALRDNTTGSYNTANGYKALFSNTIGTRNTANGENALGFNTTGNQNTANGAQALNYNISGTNNAANGMRALFNNISGNSNTAIGVIALQSNQNGNYNTGIGYNTNVYYNDLTNATAIGANAQVRASNALVLGSINDVNGATSSVNVGIGTTTPATRLHIVGGTDAEPNDTLSGYFVTGEVTGSNIVIDNNEIMARNNGITSTLFLQNDGGSLETGGQAYKPGGGNWIATSDARLKQNIAPFKDGLQQLLQINPVNYQYNNLSGYDVSKKYIGVIAQDMQKIAPYMVTGFNKNGTEYLQVDNSPMLYMLINAVKEQQAQLSSQDNQIDELKKQIAELKLLITGK